jgi:hypothetical protein
MLSCVQIKGKMYKSSLNILSLTFLAKNRLLIASRASPVWCKNTRYNIPIITFGVWTDGLSPLEKLGQTLGWPYFSLGDKPSGHSPTRVITVYYHWFVLWEWISQSHVGISLGFHREWWTLLWDLTISGWPNKCINIMWQCFIKSDSRYLYAYIILHISSPSCTVC